MCRRKKDSRRYPGTIDVDLTGKEVHIVGRCPDGNHHHSPVRIMGYLAPFGSVISRGFCELGPAEDYLWDVEFDHSVCGVVRVRVRVRVRKFNLENLGMRDIETGLPVA